MMRALVIGGTGFIGLNLVDALLAVNADVAVTRRKKSVTAFVRRRPISLIDAELSDEASLVSAMKEVDVVFFAAGHYPRYSLDREGSIARATHEVQTVCASALRAKVPRLVYTATTAILERRNDGQPSTEDDVSETIPHDSVYRAVKWAMQREIASASAKGLDVVTVLPGGCLGPWDARLGTGGLLVGAITGELSWFTDGLVNLVDVRDVARAHVLAATKGKSGRSYAIAGRARRLSMIFDEITRRYGGRVPPLELPSDKARTYADQQERRAASHNRRVPFPRELVDIVAHGHPVSNARVTSELGIELTPLEQSMEDAVRWFERFGYLNTFKERRVAMDRTTREQRVFSLIAEIRETSIENVHPESRLREDLGMDSLQSLELLSSISEDFRIHLEMENAMGIRTVQDACRFVEQAYLEAHGSHA